MDNTYIYHTKEELKQIKENRFREVINMSNKTNEEIINGFKKYIIDYPYDKYAEIEFARFLIVKETHDVSKKRTSSLKNNQEIEYALYVLNKNKNNKFFKCRTNAFKYLIEYYCENDVEEAKKTYAEAIENNALCDFNKKYYEALIYINDNYKDKGLDILINNPPTEERDKLKYILTLINLDTRKSLIINYDRYLKALDDVYKKGRIKTSKYINLVLKLYSTKNKDDKINQIYMNKDKYELTLNSLMLLYKFLLRNHRETEANEMIKYIENKYKDTNYEVYKVRISLLNNTFENNYSEIDTIYDLLDFYPNLRGNILTYYMKNKNFEKAYQLASYIIFNGYEDLSFIKVMINCLLRLDKIKEAYDLLKKYYPLFIKYDYKYYELMLIQISKMLNINIDFIKGNSYMHDQFREYSLEKAAENVEYYNNSGEDKDFRHRTNPNLSNIDIINLLRKRIENIEPSVSDVFDKYYIYVPEVNEYNEITVETICTTKDVLRFYLRSSVDEDTIELQEEVNNTRVRKSTNNN